MTYKKGDGVVIKKSLGRENDQGAGKYYHGSSMKEFPLGSRGIIVSVGSDYYKVRIGGGEGYFEDRELKLDEKLEQEKQARLNSSLEKALLSTQEVMPENPEEKNLNPLETESGRNLPGMLNKILKYFTNPFYHEIKTGSFEPKFNVREEFAVWMEQEFSSDLGERTRKKRITARKDEVYKAAIQACEHGVNTTDTCIHNRFSSYLDDLKSSGDLYASVEQLLELIKQVSINVHGNTERHYGTKVIGRR